MVNKENVRVWVKALQSGEYEQTTGQLRQRSVDKYCCLGVACDVSGVGHWYDNWYGTEESGRETSLPHDVMDWLGLDEDNPTVDPEFWVTKEENDQRLLTTLVALNDEAGLSFDVIGKIIEETYLKGDQ